MIEIKTLFNGWEKADVVRVKKWAKAVFDGATAMKEAEKIDYINSRLKGAALKGFENGKPIIEKLDKEKAD